tara:strand:+ start:585 stop:698 length:114 start_codon:yes stop_codon:yes gene_type:complete
MDENIKKELKRRRPLNLLAIVLSLLFAIFGFLLFFKS